MLYFVTVIIKILKGDFAASPFFYVDQYTTRNKRRNRPLVFANFLGCNMLIYLMIIYKTNKMTA